MAYNIDSMINSGGGSKMLRPTGPINRLAYNGGSAITDHEVFTKTVDAGKYFIIKALRMDDNSVIKTEGKASVVIGSSRFDSTKLSGVQTLWSIGHPANFNEQYSPANYVTSDPIIVKGGETVQILASTPNFADGGNVGFLLYHQEGDIIDL